MAMMNAREMFEGIGYKLSEAYSKDTLISYFDGKKNITIEFYIKNKQFKKAKGVFDCVAIKESELKAIIQQCKELGWLEEEKQETKQETNIKHYFEYLSKVGLEGFALVNGRFTKCSGTCCSECDFSGDCSGNCNKKRLGWLASPYKKPSYKLTKFEFDLLRTNNMSHDRKLSSFATYKNLKEIGYFKDIDFNLTIDEILTNCEVI